MSNYFLNKAETVFDKYPRLKNLACFKKDCEGAQNYSDSEWKAICKYVVYRVDRDSPIAQLADEQQARETAVRESYLPANIADLIRKEDDEILFINDMIVEFLLLVRDYRMQELVSIRGILRKIMMSSISPNMEMQVSSKGDASHHFTMIRSLEKFPDLSKRAIELERELFGLHQNDKEEEKGSGWEVASISERMAKQSLY